MLQAVISGNVEIAQLLFDAGASPDAPLNLGERPLHVAAAHGRAAMIHLLCSKDADKNAR